MFIIYTISYPVCTYLCRCAHTVTSMDYVWIFSQISLSPPPFPPPQLYLSLFLPVSVSFSLSLSLTQWLQWILSDNSIRYFHLSLPSPISMSLCLSVFLSLSLCLSHKHTLTHIHSDMHIHPSRNRAIIAFMNETDLISW